MLSFLRQTPCLGGALPEEVIYYLVTAGLFASDAKVTKTKLTVWKVAAPWEETSK